MPIYKYNYMFNVNTSKFSGVLYLFYKCLLKAYKVQILPSAIKRHRNEQDVNLAFSAIKYIKN